MSNPTSKLNFSLSLSIINDKAAIEENLKSLTPLT